MAADSLITFGRYYIYIFAFAFVVSWVLKGRKLINFRLILGIGLAGATMVILSSLRFEDGVGFMQFVDRYVIGYHIFGIFLLDHFLEGGIQYENWYGGATFSGLLFILSKPFDLAGIDFSNFLSSETAYQQSIPIKLGETTQDIFFANSFYTMISDMYIDGGWAGVVLLTVVLGAVYGAVIAAYSYRPSSRLFSLIILFMIVMFFSILKNQFSQLYLNLAFLFFIFVPQNVYSFRTRS